MLCLHIAHWPVCVARVAQTGLPHFRFMCICVHQWEEEEVLTVPASWHVCVACVQLTALICLSLALMPSRHPQHGHNRLLVPCVGLCARVSFPRHGVYACALRMFLSNSNFFDRHFVILFLFLLHFMHASSFCCGEQVTLTDIKGTQSLIIHLWKMKKEDQ